MPWGSRPRHGDHPRSDWVHSSPLSSLVKEGPGVPVPGTGPATDPRGREGAGSHRTALSPAGRARGSHCRRLCMRRSAGRQRNKSAVESAAAGTSTRLHEAPPRCPTRVTCHPGNWPALPLDTPVPQQTTRGLNEFHLTPASWAHTARCPLAGLKSPVGWRRLVQGWSPVGGERPSRMRGTGQVLRRGRAAPLPHTCTVPAALAPRVSCTH